MSWSDRTARPREFSADIVVVSCGAINSAALLLRSANDKHPSGLANGSDVVGRHYMGHVNSVLMASRSARIRPSSRRLSRSTISISAPTTWQYPDGAHLLRRQAGRSHAERRARRRSRPASRWI